VRSEKDYFDDIQDVKVTKDMLDLAKHIVEQKSAAFEPDNFEDHYEAALIDLINKKRSGVHIGANAAPKTGGNVISLMDALKRSLTNETRSAPATASTKGKKQKKRIEGQREMLLPISGKRPKEESKKAEKPRRTSAPAKKAG
jgi:DNA end-binding protein Ku